MFLFNSTFKVKENHLEALIIFSGQLEGDSDEYGYLFERLMKNDKPKPEIVFFIYPHYLTDIISKISEPESSFYDNIIRYGENIPVVICSFDEYGYLSVEKEFFCKKHKIELDGFTRQIINDGVLNLAKRRKDAVILKAPPGTIFLKPSKKQLDEFIQASGLTVGYSENQFLAFTLLWNRPKAINIEHIYIDTAGISAFIEALTYYIYRFSSRPCKQVKYHSYNSYFGIEKAKPDDVSNIWVIVSASATNSMGKKLVNTWGLTEEQVVTVLSFTDKESDGKGDNIICNISAISDRYQNPEKFLPTLPVTIHGENFTAQIHEPNKVSIKEKHKPNAISQCVNPFNNTGTFLCMKTSSSSDSARPIYVKMETLFNGDNKLNEWIENIANWYIPTTLKWIVYDKNNKASKLLYKQILEYLPNPTTIKSVEYKQAETEISGDGALLVLEPVISNGKSLLRLNRNLRISGHNGNRIFICPFVTATSEEGFKVFKNSLIFGPNKLKYMFHNLYSIFIGHLGADNSWILERNVTGNFESLFWQKRTAVLNREGYGLNGAIGISSFNIEENLSFTQDFAFWDKGYDCATINPEAVYVTVASILQRLREKPYRPDDTESLFSHVYQHSVIDPDNFGRFNDSLIQSCLWRSANASEVDYKSDDSLSESFSGILDRYINEMSEHNTNASLDLLMGIAIGKITLTKNVLRRSITHAKSKLSEFEHAIELLNYIDKQYLTK